MTKNENESNENAPDLSSLDYWSFVELAAKRIGEEIDDTDAMASKVIITLNRAANLVVYDLESSVHRPRGLSWSAFRLLFVVWLAGPIEPGRAAKLAGMSRAAVSSLSNTLVGKGMLEKNASELDARTTLLQLTPEGKEHARTTFQEQNKQEARWVSALTDVEQQVLVMILGKLMSHRQAVGGRIRE